MGATAELCLERHYDAACLNELVNHPKVRPTCGGDGASLLDFSSYVRDRSNHVLVWDHGFFMFSPVDDKTYMVDIGILPEGRGRDAYRLAKLGLAYIASQGAERVLALVSPKMKALRHYAVQAGFEPLGTSTSLDIGFGPVTYDLYEWKA